MTTNIDLVDSDVIDKYTEISKTYRREYLIDSVVPEEENFSLDFSAITPPIDRIRIASLAVSSSATMKSDDMQTCVFDGSEEPIVGCSIGRKICLSNGPKIDHEFHVDHFAIVNRDFVLIFSGLSLSLINTGTRAIVVTHEIPIEVSRTHIACIERIDNFQFVVATNDGAVYFVYIRFAQTAIELDHQLVIGANSTTLGTIISLKKSNFFLAILSDKSVIILNVSEKQPKVAIKIAQVGGIPGESFIAWFNSNCLLVRTRQSNFFIVEEIGNGIFEQKHCFVPRTSFHSIVFPPTSLVGFLETRDQDWGLVMVEMEKFDNGWRMKCFPHLRHELVKDCTDRALVAGTSSHLFSFALRGTTCDVHSIKLCNWTEVVNSLVYSEKFAEGIVVMEAVRRGSVFGSQREFPPTLISQIVEAGNEGRIESNFFLKFMYYQEFLDFDISDELVEKLIDLIDSFDPSKIPSALFQRLMMKLSSSVLDKLIVRTIFHSCCAKTQTTSFPIDLNSAIRIATVQDLQTAIIMIHIYLLQDFVFPIKYLMSAPADNAREITFYMFSIFNGLPYPFWNHDQSVSYDLVSARSQLRDYMVAECGLAKLVASGKQIDSHFLLNSVLFEKDFALDKEDEMFDLKCAVLDGTLATYLGDGKKYLKQLLTRDLNPKLFIEVFNTVGLPDVHDRDQVVATLDMLLAATSLDTLVLVKVIDENFVEPVGLNEMVDLLVQRNRVDIALVLLETRRGFHEICRVVKKCRLSRDIVKVLQGITERSGELFDMDELVSLWANAITSGLVGDLDAADKWMTKVDLVKLLQSIEDVHVMTQLTKSLIQKRELLKQCSVLYGIDVGNQFNQLVRKKDRAKGFQCMATICHVCLDPLLSKRTGGKRICFFTCGHLTHEDCCDLPPLRDKTKTLIKCPACV